MALRLTTDYYGQGRAAKGICYARAAFTARKGICKVCAFYVRGGGWGMRFSREWAMPSHETFSILPIRELIARYLMGVEVVVDPFARNSSITSLSNDHDPSTTATYHMDAREFLAQMHRESVRADLVLYDPPYSPRQISEHYKRLGLPCTTETTQHSLFRAECGRAIDAVVKPGGIVVSFGWDSNGVGNQRCYEIEEIMLVAHGSGHHDTIVTVQRKLQGDLDFSAVERR